MTSQIRPTRRLKISLTFEPRDASLGPLAAVFSRELELSGVEESATSITFEIPNDYKAASWLAGWLECVRSSDRVHTLIVEAVR
jgi:hypothetical protein